MGNRKILPQAQLIETKKVISRTHQSKIFANFTEKTLRDQLKKMAANEARIERKVGQLVLDKDFLLKKCEQLGIDVNVKP